MNNVLLIGVGYWGKNWYKCLLKMKTKFSVCDVSFLENDIDTNNIPCYSCVEDAFSSNVFTHAIISTSANTHLDLFLYCSDFIKPENILIEKPCGCSSKQASLMNEAFPGFLFLYSNPFNFIKENLNLIGDPLYYHSTRASMGPRIRTDVSIIEDYLVHDLYISQALFGKVIDGNSLMSQNFSKSIKSDSISVNLSFKDDVACHLFSSWVFPVKTRQIYIVGSNGSFIWQNDELFFSKARYEDIEGIDSYGNHGYQLMDSEHINKIELDDTSSLECELNALLDGRKCDLKIIDVWNLIDKLKGQ